VKPLVVSGVGLFVMNPLEPQDPLWKLLGKVRDVDVRPQFLQKVVREARNTPQEQGWLAALKFWWADSAAAMPVGRLVAGAAVVVALGVMAVNGLKEPAADGPVVVVAEPVSSAVIEAPLVPEVETQLESLDYLDELLALEDTSALSDREIAYLLY
jgi:hypothetical protein